MTMKQEEFISQPVDVRLSSHDEILEAIDYDQLMSYDYYLIDMSGGKDSQNLVFGLLDLDIQPEQMELHHHLVDGWKEHPLFDWPVIEDYNRKFAEHFGIPLYFSWREGGIKKEMFRYNSPTAPIRWQNPDGSIGSNRPRTTDKYLRTRLKYPQVVADLNQRWCSAYVKIDVGTTLIANQHRFRDKKTLVLSGERAEESAARKNYKTFEPDRSDLRNGKRYQRHVDRARIVHKFTERQIWDQAKKYRIRPAPPYEIGWSRLSCRFCIFGSGQQWKTLELISPDELTMHIENERDFGVTIKRKKNIEETIANANPLELEGLDDIIKLALSDKYDTPIYVEDWELPRGAFAKNFGPS